MKKENLGLFIRTVNHCIVVYVRSPSVFVHVQCGPCRAFTPQLVKTYNQVKEAGNKFEIIFCSSDRETESFQEYYSSMPWLALPYGDSRKKSLSRVFDVSGKCLLAHKLHQDDIYCCPSF